MWPALMKRQAKVVKSIGNLTVRMPVMNILCGLKLLNMLNGNSFSYIRSIAMSMLQLHNSVSQRRYLQRNGCLPFQFINFK